MAMILLAATYLLGFMSFMATCITWDSFYDKKWAFFWRFLFLFCFGYVLGTFVNRSNFIDLGYERGFSEGQFSAFRGHQMWKEAVKVSVDTTTTYIIDSTKLPQH